MRRFLSFKQARLILPLALVYSCPPVLANGLSFSTAADFTTGQYGGVSSTDIWYVPFTARYDKDRASFRVIVPYLNITGPGNVLGPGIGGIDGGGTIMGGGFSGGSPGGGGVVVCDERDDDCSEHISSRNENNSGSGNDDDDNSGSGSEDDDDDDDSSGPGSGDDDDDNSGPGSGDDDDDDDNSDPGSGDDDGDGDNSDPGSGDDDGDGDNSGPGSGDDDDDSSGPGSGDDDDDDDDDDSSGSGSDDDDDIDATGQSKQRKTGALGLTGGIPLGGPALTRSTQSGLGDIITAFSYNLIDHVPSGIAFDITARLKIPTASASDNLGSGKVDYAIQGDLFKTVSKFTFSATFGYRILGNPSGITFHNVLYGAAGVGYRLSPAITIGTNYTMGQSPVRLQDSRDLTFYLSQRVTGNFRLNIYGLRGFSERSPDWGGGLNLRYVF
jgi:hypothetical protein